MGKRDKLSAQGYCLRKDDSKRGWLVNIKRELMRLPEEVESSRCLGLAPKRPIIQIDEKRKNGGLLEVRVKAV